MYTLAGLEPIVLQALVGNETVIVITSVTLNVDGDIVT
jgi:hypothetical protein